MTSPPLHIQNARVLTLAPQARNSLNTLRGRAAMNDLAILPYADVFIRDGRIHSVTPSAASPGHAHTRSSPSLPADTVSIDARGQVLMPGFVDCHTHACWTGSRIDEWQMKLAGKTYQQIAAAGGGIMSTVRAVRASTQADLNASLLAHLDLMLRCGSTTIEVKSGYGLTTNDEARMLLAIEHARARTPATLVSTALLGHAVNPDHPGNRDDFIHETIHSTLPLALATGNIHAIDAFCETGAWTLDECLQLFRAAIALRATLAIRVHADQFNSLGMIPAAIALGARSVDHLEASTPADLDALADSDTFAVILPNCGFHLDGRYANARRLVDAGAKLCLATNFNPGSAPSPSIPMAIALAVRHSGLTPAEAIIASSRNPAALLGLTDRGTIAPGARADLLLLHHTDERALAYEFGTNPIQHVITAGTILPPAMHAAAQITPA